VVDPSSFDVVVVVEPSESVDVVVFAAVVCVVVDVVVVHTPVLLLQWFWPWQILPLPAGH
jgi:hypothetical protein